MINPDEFEPAKKPVTPRDLTVMSIDELRAYVAAMEAEITRAETAIDAKTKHRSGIEALFGKSE
ncbi:MAG: DUF1192 domain-containing protein [Alphaproteobacteria bacterium]|nr:DUF1192 domain-containing protein [Alphaproteobacteria bacterium]MBV8549592.1 DUF1192 domain-containing protein [Alphaproteobacteria bacterium]